MAQQSSRFLAQKQRRRFLNSVFWVTLLASFDFLREAVQVNLTVLML
jgi:hypothetical protein